MTATEITSNIRITQVWGWLGGGKVRRNRAQAFYRGGDGFSVHLRDDKGSYIDFVDGSRGGILDLVVRVRGGTRADALHWVADMIGATLDDRPSISRSALVDTAKIAADAVYFTDAALVLAEEQLESLAPDDPERIEWNRLVRALRVSPEAEYREWWSNGNAQTAAALVQAGRERARRMQTLLAAFLDAEVFDAAA
jgi:hypothetical protein